MEKVKRENHELEEHNAELKAEISELQTASQDITELERKFHERIVAEAAETRTGQPRPLEGASTANVVPVLAGKIGEASDMSGRSTEKSGKSGDRLGIEIHWQQPELFKTVVYDNWDQCQQQIKRNRDAAEICIHNYKVPVPLILDS